MCNGCVNISHILIIMWKILVFITLGFLLTNVINDEVFEDLEVISIDEYFDDNSTFNTPIVPKCCNLTQDKSNEGTGCVDSWVPMVFMPDLYELNDSSINNYSYTQLTIVVGHQCKYGLFALDTEKFKDEYYVLENGTLFVPHLEPNLLNIGQFCLDRINGSFDITALLCTDSLTAKSGAIHAAVLIISTVFLLMTFLIYVIVPKLRTVLGKCLIHYIGVLLITFVTLTFIQFNEEEFSYFGCKITAYITNFSSLISFFWLNALCFHLWMDLRYCLKKPLSLEENKKLMIIYKIWAYGMSALIFIVNLCLDTSSYHIHGIRTTFDSTFCSFHSKESIQWLLYIPMGVSMLINVLLSINTIMILCKRLPQARKALKSENMDDIELIINTNHRLESHSIWFKISFTLIVVMGLCWIFRFISWSAEKNTTEWIVTDIFYLLQGICPFAVAVVYPKAIRKRIYQLKNIADCERKNNE